MTDASDTFFAEDFAAPAAAIGAASAADSPRAENPVVSILRRFMALLERQPPWLLWLEAIALTVAIGYVDYASGYEVSAVLLYSLPILLMVRFADQQAAIFLSLLCALTWWWADEQSGHHYTTVWHQTWETAVRLGYFLTFALCGATLKARMELLARAQRLELEIIRISESEQHRIGQDLHDGLCQYLAAVGCSAGSVKTRLERSGSPEAPAVQEIQDLILDGVQQTRALARGLFPVQNDEWGLPSALEELAASTSRLQNLRCTFTSNRPTTPISAECGLHLFRIAQEAVRNAIHHGAASVATISLLLSDDALVLSIEDNGSGFVPAARDRRGLGLTIMQYRIRQIGGSMTLRNHAGGGAVVTCRVPFPANAIAHGHC